jgi:septal ring factor EnvC (AmiA/AmiB activator)
MRTAIALPLALLGVLASGVALGVTGPVPGPIDRLGPSQRGAAPARAPARALTPTEVEIALKELSSERESLKLETKELAKRLGETEARLQARGRAYYKQLRTGLLPAGGGFDELVDHAARVERTRLSLTRDLEASSQVRRRMEEIELRLHALESDLAPLEAQKKAWDSAKNYQRQADDRRAAFDRAFGASSLPDAVTVYGRELGPEDATTTASGFVSLHGTLPLPMAGRTQVHIVEGSSGPGTAVELHGPAGSTARAVAAGRVAFVDRDEWNRLAVILDHGGRYFTVYSNLRETGVKSGETVPTGAALGPVLEQKGESVLVFELRQEGRAVPATPWFGL